MSSPDDRIILTRSNLQAFIDGVKQKVAASVVDALFPVGFVYITSKAPEDGGDPNDLFPGTTWSRLEGAFICAAGDSDTADGPNATPHGSSLRNGGDLPSHRHSINNASGKTGTAGAASGSVSKLLYKGDQSVSASGILSASNTAGSWYGHSYIPNNTTFVKLSLIYKVHNHLLPTSTQTNTSNLYMSVTPKWLNKYYWERTL